MRRRFLMLLGALGCTSSSPSMPPDARAADAPLPVADAWPGSTAPDAFVTDARTCMIAVPSDAGAPTGATAIDEVVDGFCMGMSRCGGNSENLGATAVLLADPASCRARAAFLSRLSPGLIIPELEREGYTLDPTAAQACARRLAARCPYGDLRRMAGPGYDDPCERMLVAAAPVAAGGACRAAADCAGGGACVSTSKECGERCGAPLAAGELCASPESCVDPPGEPFAACILHDLVARCGAGTFGPAAGEGQPCGALVSEDGRSVRYAGCQDGLSCSAPRSDRGLAWSAGVCRAPSEPGGACSPCPLGTACECITVGGAPLVFTSCKCGGCGGSPGRLAREGEACGLCDEAAGLACVDGVCRRVVEGGSAGDPCLESMVCENCVAGWPCPRFASRSDELASVAGPIVTPGCRVWSTCKPGLYCGGTDRYNGTCAPRLADGETCDLVQDSCSTGNCGCASGACESQADGVRCVPRPSCP